ncbi:toll-like receptor 2 [Mya arenaria]|uniref:toll-like receptor 2 n=1 Tax=Mya arenaria TaxID=6604 RepID=UPI0022E9422D|nr:toll-like receptor 2 [Mya arenaria]XP_052765031.1 toll-like receptor 2 [Mya arenaria]XP_052765032.1 toll-like receptor 2 [Mya arenaria]XP_052765033.1 toll-like receptor 2 [Mya arenaria]XP_052765035.1 toll-like receptor 2 [Mya arenaria]
MAFFKHHFTLMLLITLAICLQRANGKLSERPSQCPDSRLCKCSRSKNGQCDYNCYGNKVQNTLRHETLPENIRKLHVERFLFETLSVEQFPPNISVRIFYSKHNKIWDMKNNTFSKFESLTEVWFSGGTLRIKRQLLDAIERIKGEVNLTLAFENMRLDNLTESSLRFQGSVNLTNLRLNRNDMAKLRPELIKHFHNLKKLSVVDNAISSFSNTSTQLDSLTHLDISNNRLSSSTIRFCFDNDSALFPNLRNLNVAKNFISKIEEKSWKCFKKLKYLNLSDNKIQVFEINSIGDLVSLETLDLSNNWINSKEGIIPGKYPPQLRYLDLSANQLVPFMPKICDQSSNDTIGITKLNLKYNHISVLTPDYTKCLRNLTELQLSKNAIKEIMNNAFAHFPKLSILHMDRQIHGLKNVSENAFNITDLTELDLRGNFLTFKDNSFEKIFIAFKHVEKLNLTDNHIVNKTAFISTLAHLKNLKTLALRRVGLNIFPYELFTTFDKLTNIRLDQNAIKAIYFPSNITIKSKVKFISVGRNCIEFPNKSSSLFPEEVMHNLKRLNMEYNFFDCSCDESSRWFRSQIKSNTRGGFLQNVKLVGWPSGYLCRSPREMVGTRLDDYHLSANDCRPPDPYIPAYIGSACTVFVIAVIATMFYWNRWYIQYYWHRLKKKCKPVRGVSDPERQPLVAPLNEMYDAYVIYNHNDMNFVLNNLRRLLEDKLNYKLLLWDREGGVGGSKTDAYFEAMERSKNVIVVVSNNLMNDAWCEFQIDIALLNKVETRGRKNIFLVILTDMDLESVSKSWCVLLTKKGNGKWCETENSIRRKVFVEDMKATLGKPLSDC